MDFRIELIGMYRDDPAGLGVLLTFLDTQDRENSQDSTAWTMLRELSSCDLPVHLRTYADAIISEETSQRLSNKR